MGYLVIQLQYLRNEYFCDEASDFPQGESCLSAGDPYSKKFMPICKEEPTMSRERRKQFTFYASYFDTVMSLPKRRQWPTMLAVIQYALEGEEPEEGSLYSKTVFTAIRPNIDSSRTKAEQKLREKRAAGLREEPDPLGRLIR